MDGTPVIKSTTGFKVSVITAPEEPFKFILLAVTFVVPDEFKLVLPLAVTLTLLADTVALPPTLIVALPLTSTFHV